MRFVLLFISSLTGQVVLASNSIAPAKQQQQQSHGGHRQEKNETVNGELEEEREFFRSVWDRREKHLSRNNSNATAPRRKVAPRRRKLTSSRPQTSELRSAIDIWQVASYPKLLFYALISTQIQILIRKYFPRQD